MSTKGSLKLSESFISIQGEGKTIGTPAVFWRFSDCTFACSWCDTIEVWRRGIHYTFEQLYDIFQRSGHFSRLNHHSHHLVITGGDPLLQQDDIVAFLHFCRTKGEKVDDWFIECENHGYLKPSADILNLVNLWNISPKLTNSGISEHKRIVPENLSLYVNQCQAIFKFPVKTQVDLLEVIAFQRRFAVQSGRIWLMPICASRAEHELVGREVAELCITHGFKFSPRLQLVLWDKATGV